MEWVVGVANASLCHPINAADQSLGTGGAQVSAKRQKKVVGGISWHWDWRWHRLLNPIHYVGLKSNIGLLKSEAAI